MMPSFDALLFAPSAIAFDPKAAPLPRWLTAGWCAIAAALVAITFAI